MASLWAHSWLGGNCGFTVVCVGAASVGNVAKFFEVINGQKEANSEPDRVLSYLKSSLAKQKKFDSKRRAMRLEVIDFFSVIDKIISN